MKDSFAFLIPFMGSVFGISTIIACWASAMDSGYFPESINTPPISFLAVGNARLIYRVGFSITGVLFYLVIHYFQKLCYVHFKNEFPSAASYAFYSGYATCFGVVAQGVIILQDDIFQKIFIEKSNEELDSHSTYHQLLALFFFQGAAVHCYSSTYIAFNTNVEILRTTKWLKLFLTFFSLMGTPIIQAIHPAFVYSTGGSQEFKSFNEGGLMQWIVVGTYILYFAIYSIDFYLVQTYPPKVQEEKKTN